MASALGISGQQDLDIYALANPNKLEKYFPSLIKAFGRPESSKSDSIAWEFEQEGYGVEFYLTDPNSAPMRRQVAVFNILQNNKKRLEEYEKLKKSMKGKSLRDYQRKNLKRP